jgi:hypothetical protein
MNFFWHTNQVLQLTEYTAEGKQTRHIDLEEPNKLWQHVRMINLRAIEKY